MTQEEKQLLLLKDLSARLPYGVKVWFPSGIAPIVLDEFVLSVARRRDEEFNPYLRPMSSMTEEEKKEYDRIIERTNERIFNSKFSGEEKRYIFWDIEEVDFLNAHHFDYRGLIEKGLALKAPEGMY